MPLIIASISEYANKYIEDWVKENDISKGAALNSTISGVRREAENIERSE